VVVLAILIAVSTFHVHIHMQSLWMDRTCYSLIFDVTKSLFSKHLCGAIAW
jgi:hypothetical protein